MANTKLKQLKIAIFGIILACFSVHLSQYAYAENQDRLETNNVLILNSYHQGFPWTREETDGIVNTILESDRNISILIEYMDWKNHPDDENINYLKDYYRYKYRNKKIDIIITTDDAALKFALENRKDLFSDAPVIFCGVNKNGVKNLTEGYDRVSGVIEEVDPTETIKIAKYINPSLKNIYLLYDNSESGLSTGNIVKEKIKSFDPSINIMSYNNLAFEEIISNVKVLKQDSIILITTYHSDVNNNTVEMDFLTKEVSKYSSVPVYHLYDFGMNYGAIGGAMLCGWLQGENAADLAFRVLNGESLETVPVITPISNRIIFDYQQLIRFGISIKEIPRNSEIINKPFSFFDTYKTLVLSVIAAFIILIVFVGILMFYLAKIQRMKKHLSDSHEELTQIYEELAASDEEMRQQYDEILSINEKIKLGDEKSTYLAHHDSLTGLLNKLSLYEKSESIFVSERGKVAVLFVDIDNFKFVNDTMGHAFGDQLIISVSERLTSLLSPNYSIYRFGGDEFVMILEDIKDRIEVEAFASKILKRFTEEFEILNSILHISLSIGIVMYPEHSDDLEHLLKYADIAMYGAKEGGRKRYVIYSHLMNEVFTERVNIEKHLHNALGNNEFEVYYQPQLDLKTNKISGFEALLRWKNIELGNVSPLKFIKVAEDTHFIIPLGTWVLNKACEFLKSLNELGFMDLIVSVNISILQLLQTDFCDIVDETLNRLQIESKYLELEITESILMESFESIGDKLERLTDKNVRIALDDFGKGYSSLNYLKQLPIDTLKVDKTFIDNITETGEDTLTGHIVTIGKSMGMCIVAEGVERQEQLNYLIQHDCDKIQGYLYSRPIPGEELIKLLKKEWEETTI